MDTSLGTCARNASDWRVGAMEKGRKVMPPYRCSYSLSLPIHERKKIRLGGDLWYNRKSVQFITR
jgi:hypothetical protein